MVNCSVPTVCPFPSLGLGPGRAPALPGGSRYAVHSPEPALVSHTDLTQFGASHQGELHNRARLWLPLLFYG